MNPPPRLSVVVPTHDTLALTLRCLETLAACGPGVEVVLVDDGSRDGTAEAVAARFSSVLVLRNPAPLGFSRSANLGLAAASGPLLLLLNSDTEIPPDAPARFSAAFDSDPELGIAGAQLYYPDGSAQWSGGRAPTRLWLFVLASGTAPLLRLVRLGRPRQPSAGAQALDSAPPRRLDWVTGAALALRRTVWQELGPLDEDYRFYAQDLDFCWRAGRAGWKVEVRPEIRILHHHGSSIAGRPGSFRRQNHALLWSDLLLWARKAKGDPWARSARRWMALGARLRLALRALALPFRGADERATWRRETDSLRRALAALPLAFRPPGG